MATSLLDPPTYDLNSETTWRELYPRLRSLAKHFVYSFHVVCWRGQEDDIVEDIVQETARRMLEHSQRAERGEVTPIHSLEHMLWTVACHCCIDMRRHGRRFVRTLSDGCLFERYVVIEDQVNLTEEATENVYREWLFMLLARQIANFPHKQRKALLIDLANLMHFEEQPTPLQKAFLAVGIQLQEYRQPLPDNPVERARHASLLCHAYKRIAQLLCVQEDASAA